MYGYFAHELIHLSALTHLVLSFSHPSWPAAFRSPFSCRLTGSGVFICRQSWRDGTLLSTATYVKGRPPSASPRFAFQVHRPFRPRPLATAQNHCWEGANYRATRLLKGNRLRQGFPSEAVVKRDECFPAEQHSVLYFDLRTQIVIDVFQETCCMALFPVCWCGDNASHAADLDAFTAQPKLKFQDTCLRYQLPFDIAQQVSLHWTPDQTKGALFLTPATNILAFTGR